MKEALKYWYKVDENGKPVEQPILARTEKPSPGHYRKLFLPDCCGTFADRLSGVSTSVKDLDGAILTQDQWKAIIELAMAKLQNY
jgi:hypothetical protein